MSVTHPFPEPGRFPGLTYSKGVLWFCALVGAGWVIHSTVPPGGLPILLKVWGFAAALVVGFPVVSFLVHELAHAGAGLILGYRVRLVCCWVPFPLVHVRILGTWFAFGHSLGRGGLCVLYPKSPSIAPSMLVYAVGPLSNLALAGAARLSIRWIGESRVIAIGLAVFAIYNLYLFVINCLPITLSRQGEPLTTDGRSFLAILKMKSEAASVWTPLHYGAGQLAWGDAVGALASFQKMLTTHPENVQVKFYLASAHLDLGNLVEAKGIWETFLSQGDARLVAVAKNNIASVIVRSKVPDDLPRADLLSREALDSNPGNRYFIGTRGMVLYALRRLDESRPLLLKAYRSHREPGARGILAAYLGLIVLDENNENVAKTFLDRALYLSGGTFASEHLSERLRTFRREE